jgi:hypothetical protein
MPRPAATRWSSTDARSRLPKLEPIGQLQDLLRRANEVVHAGNSHEHQPDRKQHLIQVRPVVERAVERALEQRANQRRA